MRTQHGEKAESTAQKTLWTALAVAVLCAAPAAAQTWTPGQLDNLVSRIALYPDPLLAQVLTASTYADQIPDAAAYADQHSYLQGDDLERAIEADNPPWDPAVLALLPFPSVLDLMDRDMNWTRDLGDAVLESREAVMDAVQRLRRRAYENGTVRDCEQYRVMTDGPYIELLPTDPAVVYVPVYDPYWLYAPPRAGFVIGISFAARVPVTRFVAIGWRTPRLDWRSHAVVIDHRPWQRDMTNRATYVHNYREPVVVHQEQAGRPMAAEGVHQHAEGPRPQADAGRGFHETHEVRPTRPDRVEQKPAPRHEEKREEPKRDKK